MSTVAERLAGWAVAQASIALPAEVRAMAMRHVLDQLAVQVDGSGRPSVRAIRTWAEKSSPPGRAVVVGADIALAPTWAAIVNAAAATAFENDDFHPAGLIHAYSAVVPAVLAICDEEECDWERALTAIAIGVEAATRISIAGQPGMNSERGIHPTSAVAPFGVALAVGLLRGLDAVTLTQALGICGSFAGGVLEYSRSGGQVKRLHTSVAAEAGIRAVDLAILGIDGPRTVVEGPRGVLAAFSSTYDDGRHPAEVVDGLGERWELLGTAVKPYFTNGLIQGPIAATIALCSSNGLTSASIDTIDIGIDSMAASVCAPTALPPRDLVDAQFSLPFGVALAVVTGGGTLSEYLMAEAAEFDIPEVTALARRVRFHVDPESDAVFPRRFRSTTSITAEGRQYATVTDAPGTPENPLTEEQLHAKWRSALDRDRPGRFEKILQLMGMPGTTQEVTRLMTSREWAGTTDRSGR